MRNTPDKALIGRIVIIGILLIIALVCTGAYASQQSTPAANTSYGAASFTPPVTNPDVLHNWLPDSVYNYVIARLTDYLTSNNLLTSSMSVKGSVTLDPQTYDFDMAIQPQGKVISVHVSVQNFDGVLSTAVYLNGQVQQPVIPGTQTGSVQPANTPSFSGFDGLANAGVTVVQTEELQQAIEQFAPNASTVSINTGSIASNIDPTDTTIPYTFLLSIDSTTYQATLNCVGFAQAQLLLDDQSGHQVFHSEVLSQGS